MARISNKVNVVEVLEETARDVAMMYRNDPKRFAEVENAFRLLTGMFAETYVVGRGEMLVSEAEFTL
jgi:hypothetical protein